MGYAPPPPRGGYRIVRGRRAFLRQVPGPDSGLWMLGGPDRNMKLGVEMEVLPHKNRWEWRVRLTYNGRRDPGCPESQSWRLAHGSEVRGRCRDQGKAWEIARSLANDVRATHAAVQVVEQRRHKERLPL